MRGDFSLQLPGSGSSPERKENPRLLFYVSTARAKSVFLFVQQELDKRMLKPDKFFSTKIDAFIAKCAFYPVDTPVLLISRKKNGFWFVIFAEESLPVLRLARKGRFP